jgi:hypothetical protein
MQEATGKMLRSLCLFAALVLAKAASKASCLFGLGCLFYWKAKKSPNKHPLSRVRGPAARYEDGQSMWSNSTKNIWGLESRSPAGDEPL